MKNNFKKNGRMVIRFETVEERREIIEKEAAKTDADIVGNAFEEE